MTETILMRKKKPLISIVILNWNGKQDTLRCLESVDKLSYSNIEVIVIDNGSSDPITTDDITSSTNLKIVYNKENQGFAGGHVSALPHCNGEYLFLLNNDALIDKDALSNALRVFEGDKNVAVVGGKSYSLLENEHTSLGFYAFQYVDPITAEVKTYTNDSGLQDTATVSGSAVMIKRSIIDTYGYFDERFFAYYEETDLFARYLRSGLRIIYDPSVIILHKDGASTKDKRFMYYYLMLRNQFLFAYKNFDAESKRLFLKTYTRNFRRSLWIYLKDRSKTEAIHKARVRSTVWNLLHLPNTILSRRKTLAINKHFNYSQELYVKQPLGVSLVVDATGKINAKKLEAAIEKILSLKIYPSEIIIVSDKHVTIPPHSAFITIRNIVDKKISTMSVADFGFMSSNTDILLATTYDKLLTVSSAFSRDLATIYNVIVSEEAAIAVKNFKGSDLGVTNGRSSSLVAIRKTDLVDFLVIHESIYSITNTVIGDFINWVVMECKPVSRVDIKTTLLAREVHSSVSGFPVLHSSLRWTVKKTIRTFHLARVLSKAKKIILRPHETDLQSSTPEVAKIHQDIPSKKYILETPVFINTRDRSEPLIKLLQWLSEAGYKNIIFVDNDSTYPGLLDIFARTPFQVLPLGRNGMQKAPWESLAVRFFAKGKPYIVTDPDVVPTAKTPKDVVTHLYQILYRYPSYKKVGVALKIDDLPDHYSMKQHVIDWESRFWKPSLLIEKDVYRADVDTTFALYRGDTWWLLSPSLRVGGVYEMRHEPWYQDLNKPSDDMMYYRARASNEVSTWTKGKLNITCAH